MRLDFVPLLQTQRELYRLPRGMARFQQYLRTMIDWRTEEMRLPLFSMNPMGKDHVPEFIDALLAFDADGVAARATAEAQAQLQHVPGAWKVALVVADDLAGGWTNRYATEYTHRFDSSYLHQKGWLIGMLWTSDRPPTPRSTREEVLTSIHRAAYVQEHGPARNLRERLAQEGHAMARAGCTTPAIDTEELAYTREVLAPFLHDTDMRTTIECLYGDAAGRTLGFTPRGLSAGAGLALALQDAR
jgi:hypothetical protein